MTRKKAVRFDSMWACTLPHFAGCRFGLFNLAAQTPGGHADFDHFR